MSWPRRLVALIVPFVVAPLMVLLLPASAHAADRNRPVSKVTTAMRIASAQAGDPYRYGAAGPNAFDCSGLVYFATHRAGFTRVPRTSSAQSHFMRRIARPNMRPGDFVFFHNSGGVYHVAIFTGWKNGRRVILHAPYSGTRVRREAIWGDNWFPGTLRKPARWVAKYTSPEQSNRFGPLAPYW